MASYIILAENIGTMTERQMEDLIAQFPEEFFRKHGLILRGRQQSFAEVGRFDLLFVDSFQTNVLMELKARPAKYEDASQLAKYKDELQHRGEKNLLMWLVAPQIPNSVREFLDRIGIEYSEIHLAQFSRVAERHGIKHERQDEDPIGREPSGNRARRQILRSERASVTLYPLEPNFDRTKLDELLKLFDSSIRRAVDKSVSRKLRQEALNSAPASVSAETQKQLAKWCKTDGSPYQDGQEVARKISQLLFGCILDRTRLGV